MSLADRVAARIPPDSPLANAFHRAVLAGAAPRLRGRREPSERAVRRALASTAIGAHPAGERAWIERIEARRRRMASEFSLPGEPAAAAGDRWAPTYRWSMPRVWARFLMRLVAELAPRAPLELGTGFGISALYQAAALELAGAGHLRTLDRQPELIEIAERGFAELGLERRIELTRGPIGETLSGVAAELAPVDYALIDAEHTEAATVENFDRLRPSLAAGAVVLVDDIRMDEEMRRAWATIRARPGIRLALGLRRLGVVIVEAA